MGNATHRVHEHEHGCVAQPRRRVFRVPADARFRRHAKLRLKAGERRAQRVSKPSLEIDHIEIVSLDSVRTDRTRFSWTEAVTCVYLLGRALSF
jgi:hypothetical protein